MLGLGLVGTVIVVVVIIWFIRRVWTITDWDSRVRSSWPIINAWSVPNSHPVKRPFQRELLHCALNWPTGRVTTLNLHLKRKDQVAY